jgi:mono/diheme cytochrome c family protein
MHASYDASYAKRVPDATAHRTGQDFSAPRIARSALPSAGNPGGYRVAAGGGMRVAAEETMRFVQTCLAVALLAVLHTSLPASAAETTDPGRAMYLRYCGACHGPAGKGDGIAGSFMTPKPTDLTQLAKRHGGTFSTHQVMSFIDGTTDVRAHGDPVMPVWGEMFRAEAAWDMSRRAEVQGKLLLITEYLRSIQQQ